VASGFIAGSASVVVLLHRRMQPLYFLSTLAGETAFKVSKYGATYQKSESAEFILPEKGVPSAVVGTVRR